MFKRVKRFIKLVKFQKKSPLVKFKENANCSMNSSFEGMNVLGRNTWFNGQLGYGSYIGDDCLIEGKIGRYCSIGHKVTILSGTHPTKKFVSTSPCFFSTARQNGTSYVNEQKFEEKRWADLESHFPVIIGNDVWIGYGASIMEGVTIGDGAVIGACAFVNKDVLPYSIVSGQPAKEIRKRFTEDQIHWLIEFKWWEKPTDWLVTYADLFEDIDFFIKTFSKQH